MPAGPIGNQNQITATMSDPNCFDNRSSDLLEDASAINTASI